MAKHIPPWEEGPDNEPSPPPKTETRGRPTNYKKEYALIAQKMCELGATDIEVADALNIPSSTFYLWRAKHEEFAEALTLGKKMVDERVKAALFHRAVGYEVDTQEIKIVDKEIEIVDIRKHFPPDTKAAAIWLYNRLPEEFKMSNMQQNQNSESLADSLAKLAENLPD